MKLSVILFFIFFAIPAFSEKKVLDLGEFEITGEVRRPNVNWLRSNRNFRDSVDSMTLDELKKFEEELLKPESGIKNATQFSK